MPQMPQMPQMGALEFPERDLLWNPAGVPRGPWALLTSIKGSVFTSRRLWATVSLYWLLAAVIALIVLHCEPVGPKRAKERCKVTFASSGRGALSVCVQAVSSLQFEGLEALVDCVTTLVGFLLGLYLSTSLNRWWTLRQQLALLSAAVVELLTLCSSCCQCPCCIKPHEGALSSVETAKQTPVVEAEEQRRPASCRQWAMARVHRLGLASFHLTFDDAQGKSDLQYLVEDGLLSPAEAKCLLAVAPRPSAVWLWLSTLGAQLAGSNRLLFGPNTLRRWLEVCARGSGCSLQCRTYVGTPLPWPYLHLLVTLVCISSLLISVLAGLAAAKFICCISSALAVEVYVSLNTRPRLWEAVQRLVMHLVFLFVLPTFYHGLVNLAQRINTPFGFVRGKQLFDKEKAPGLVEPHCSPWTVYVFRDTSVAFPREAYVNQIEAECEAICAAAAALPPLELQMEFPSVWPAKTEIQVQDTPEVGKAVLWNCQLEQRQRESSELDPLLPGV